MRRSSVLLGLLILLLYDLALNLPYLGTRELQGEEGTRAVVALEMIDSGDWIVPRMEGATYLNKPPLFNWLMASIFTVTGRTDELAARSISIFSSWVAASFLSLTWLAVADARGKWFILPGLVFLSFPEVIDKTTRGAEIDITFSMLVLGSLLSWFHLVEIRGKRLLGWVTAFAIAGLAFLTKGVQAPAFLYGAVVPYLIARKRYKEIFSMPHLLGLAVFISVAALWVIPLVGRLGADTVLSVWWSEIAVRGEAIRPEPLRHLWEFPLTYIVRHMPWIFFLPFLKMDMFRQDRGKKADLLSFCLCSLVFSVPLYWLIPGSWFRYVLPVSGMLALILAVPISEAITAGVWGSRPVSILMRWLPVVLGAGSAAAGVWAWSSGYVRDHGFVAAMVASAMALAIAAATRVRTVAAGLAAVMLAVVVAKNAWASVYFPHHAERMSHYRNAAREIARISGPGSKIFDLGLWNGHLAYYMREEKRPAIYIDRLDPGAMGSGSVVFMRSAGSGDTSHPELDPIGRLKVRSTMLDLFRMR